MGIMPNTIYNSIEYVYINNDCTHIVAQREFKKKSIKRKKENENKMTTDVW